MLKGGRPPALDEVKQGQICAILAVGCSRRTAAHYVGCAANTIRNTALRDPKFNEQLKKAECKLEFVQMKHIHEAAKSKQYWRAAAWALERRYPDRYGQRHPATITVDQVSQFLAQFAQIVMDELPAKYRQQVLSRLDALSADLARLSDRKAAP